MIANYHTLRALVREWRDPMIGCVLEDAHSQERGELALVLAGSRGRQAIRIGTRPPLRFMMRVDNHSKAKRNVATLFREAFGRSVEDLRIADRDRLVYLDLSGGMTIHVALFGSKARVLLVSEGRVQAAFQSASALRGTGGPVPRPAPVPRTYEAFLSRWRPDAGSVGRALSLACPLFDRTLVREAVERASMDPGTAADLDTHPGTAANPGTYPGTASDLDAAGTRALFRVVEAMRLELANPAPCIYREGNDPSAFSLIPLTHAAHLSEERFDTVDDAVRAFVRASFAQRRFRESYDPIERALEQAAERFDAGADRIAQELSRESRADRYEMTGHLLMAQASGIPRGVRSVDLQDPLSGGNPVTVSLDPALSAVENAQQCYARARRIRKSREAAESRLAYVRESRREAWQLLDELRTLDTAGEVRAFRKRHAERLARFMPGGKAEDIPGGAPSTGHIPYRRYLLPGGYQVWVGRNARQNEALTFRHARKHDYWMHARGAPGSHVVLRLPQRNAVPGRAVIEQAASIAAWFSKARGSSLVPVMIAERKFVRKPRGALPGEVAVERETVVLVEPRLPEERFFA